MHFILKIGGGGVLRCKCCICINHRLEKRTEWFIRLSIYASCPVCIPYMYLLLLVLCDQQSKEFSCFHNVHRPIFMFYCCIYRHAWSWTWSKGITLACSSQQRKERGTGWTFETPSPHNFPLDSHSLSAWTWGWNSMLNHTSYSKISPGDHLSFKCLR